MNIMFACSTCKKVLSSRQSLQYHMNSSKCISMSSSQFKMQRDAEITIECTLDGRIKDYLKQGTPVRSSLIVGKSLYDILHESCRYEMSMKHIKALAHKGTVFRIETIIIDRFLCTDSYSYVQNLIKYSCMIRADNDFFSVYLSL